MPELELTSKCFLSYVLTKILVGIERLELASWALTGPPRWRSKAKNEVLA